MDSRTKLTSKQLADIAKRVKSDVTSNDCEFVEPLPKEVQTECVICLQTLKEPYIVGCCGNRFCKACIEPDKTLKSCPLCNAKKFQKLPDKQLERLLNQRKVYCLLRGSGCRWTGERKNLSSHLDYENQTESFSSSSEDTCKLLPIPCSCCKSYFRRKDIASHSRQCHLRPSVCSYCNFKCPFKDLVSHYNTCSLYPVTCSNSCCETTFTRNMLKSHLNNDCSLQKVVCEYEYAGCREKVMRKDMACHIEKKLKKHLDLVSVQCRALIDREKARVIDVENERKLLDEQISDLVTANQRLSDENKRLKKTKKEEKGMVHISVTNLPPGVTKHNLKCVFGQYGSVVDIDLPRRASYAMVEYSQREDCEKAFEASESKGINLLQHRLKLTSGWC